MLGLSARNVAQQGDVEIRLPQVAIPLGDLVLQNQVIAERLPGDVRDDPVILVAVVAAMSENHVRRERSLDRFEHVLDLAQGGGEVPVAELVDVYPARSGPGQELAGALPGLALAGSSGTAEDDPMTVHVAPGREEGEDRAATADLDVVGVGAETKDPERARRQSERKHRALPAVEREGQEHPPRDHRDLLPAIDHMGDRSRDDPAAGVEAPQLPPRLGRV